MFYNDIRLTENRIAEIENDLDRNERKKLECVHLFNDKTYARNLTMVCLWPSLRSSMISKWLRRNWRDARKIRETSRLESLNSVLTLMVFVDATFTLRFLVSHLDSPRKRTNSIYAFHSRPSIFVLSLSLFLMQCLCQFSLPSAHPPGICLGKSAAGLPFREHWADQQPLDPPSMGTTAFRRSEGSAAFSLAEVV